MSTTIRRQDIGPNSPIELRCPSCGASAWHPSAGKPATRRFQCKDGNKVRTKFHGARRSEFYRSIGFARGTSGISRDGDSS